MMAATKALFENGIVVAGAVSEADKKLGGNMLRTKKAPGGRG